MSTQTEKSSGRKIMIAAIVLLALTNAVTLYFLLTEKHEKEQVIVEKVSLEQDYQSVTTDLDAHKAELQQMMGKNAELDKQINEQLALIDEQKAKLEEEHKQNTLTQAQLNAARKKITEYTANISDLQKQVEDYKAQTAQLSQEKEQLNTDLTNEKQTTTQLTVVKDSLAKKVDAGSYLQIAKVDVTAIKRKNNGTEVPVEKAKAAESIKVSFETGVNKVLDPGQVNLYVRIINPRGETLTAGSSSGSGIIPETESGKPVQYSKLANINYEQRNKKVVFYWTRYINDPGTYRVEIYQSGKVIGKGAVRLS